MLSLSLDLNLAYFEKIQLEKEQCLDLLRLQNPLLKALEQINEGWVCFMFQDKPLGWLKNMGSRYNNYYPNHWKIRLSK
jgi:NOL1/NOP2/fmu family ribosome biogenesis protein